MSGRVLIITSGALCRNPRVVKEADALGRAGCEVTVLHVRHARDSEALDAALASGAPFRREVVEMMPGTGWSTFSRRALVRLARSATARFGWQTLRGLGPAGSLLRRARAFSADLTIVHNEVAHGVGLRLAAEGRRVVADIEDWHSEDLLPADRAGRPLRLLRANEQALLHRCTHTTTTSHTLAAALHARYGGKRPEVIANAFPLQPDPRSERDNVGDAAPAFVWFSQRLGPGRGLEAFLAAWACTTQPSRVVLIGEPLGDYRALLVARLPRDRRAAVEFHDCVPPAQLPSLLAAHDIGLALEDRSILNRDLTITNKILQYLNAGLAVVATNTAGQREVLAHAPEVGVLVSPDDPANYAAALDRLLSERDRLAARQRAARRLAEQIYCWEREAPRLVALVERALATG